LKSIALTKGYHALVDDDDFDKVNQFKWSAYEDPKGDGTLYNVYARRNIKPEHGNRTKQFLHRFILGVVDPTVKVDHTDRDGLNCGKENLRIATVSQNQGNRIKSVGTSSQYKGVSWVGHIHKWRARIKVNNTLIHLGCSNSEIKCALMYDEAAVKHFGEFALCNF
jgi:hypothetical protein